MSKKQETVDHGDSKFNLELEFLCGQTVEDFGEDGEKTRNCLESLRALLKGKIAKKLPRKFKFQLKTSLRRSQIKDPNRRRQIPAKIPPTNGL
jgi:hypothetical protein